MREFKVAIYCGRHPAPSAYEYIKAESLEDAERIADERHPEDECDVREITNDPYNGCPMYT